MLKVVPLGLLVAVLIVGCGGDATGKEDFVSQLNAMCEDFSAREKEIGEPQTLADLRQNGPRILEAFEQAILEPARELEAPEEFAGQAERLVEIAEEQRRVLADLIAAAGDNDVVQVQQLAATNGALNREATSIARELGAEACT